MVFKQCNLLQTYQISRSTAHFAGLVFDYRRGFRDFFRDFFSPTFDVPRGKVVFQNPFLRHRAGLSGQCLLHVHVQRHYRLWNHRFSANDY